MLPLKSIECVSNIILYMMNKYHSVSPVSKQIKGSLMLAAMLSNLRHFLKGPYKPSL